MGAPANEIRFRKNPEPRVTFHVDTNPNYSNVCNVDCIFCAFYRHPGDDGAYTHTVDEMIAKFKASAAKGVTTILLQGGVNPALPFEYYLELVERTVREVPGVTPHFFSTSEILGHGARRGPERPRRARAALGCGPQDDPGRRGGDSLGPGEEEDQPPQGHERRLGRRHARGAQDRVQDDRHDDVRPPGDRRDIIEHLDVVRDLQDETGGFTAFVPWSFKPGNTPLEKIIPQYATPVRYLQMIALSRIYLDNVPHIQASWFSEGKKTGQIALHFGADDFGGTLQEENVHAAARYVNTDEYGRVHPADPRIGVHRRPSGTRSTRSCARFEVPSPAGVRTRHQ